MSFLMDEGTNELLTRVRARIEEDFFFERSKKDEEPMGDDDEADLPSGDDEDDEEDMEDEEESINLDPRTMEVLERVRARLESDLGEGTGQAKNVSDVDDALNKYMNTILDHILSEYEMDEEEAIDHMLGVADDLAASGELPPMPSDESSDEDVAFWIGKATTAGFEGAVIAALA